MRHFIYHLAPNGQAGVFLAKGALTSETSGEREIRKALVENGLIDCIFNLPAKLFLNTQIPAALWFMSRNRKGGQFPSSGGVSEGRCGYEDIPGFCAAAPKSKVAALDYFLTPGRYVGLPDEEDDFNFAERFASGVGWAIKGRSST